MNTLEKITAAAEAKDLSLAKLCTDAGLARNTLAQAKLTRRPLSDDSLAAIAAVLQLDPATLAPDEAEAEPAVEIDADPALRRIPLMRLLRSSLNPRKTFDDEAIRELADSIAVHGLLQNIVVRETREPGDDADGDPGVFQVVSGERRVRALELLYNEKRLPADLKDRGIPARVMRIDDGEHIALAILENLQRVDVAPLEEAEALRQLTELDPKRWTTGIIAEQIGRTQRYVQQRLSLANKLSPAAKQLLEKKEITVEQARILTGAPIMLQAKLIDDIKCGFVRSEQQLRARLTEHPPVGRNIFKLEEYKGAFIEADDDKKYFADTKAFQQLQAQAIQRRKELLLEKFPFVEIVSVHDGHGKYFYASEWQKSDAGGVVIQVEHNWTVIEHKGLVRVQRATSQSQTTPAKETSPVTKGHIIHTKRRKTLAMQKAVMADATMAMRLACYALLDGRDAVKITRARAEQAHDHVESEAVETTLKALTEGAPEDPKWGPSKGAELWSWVLALDVDHLHALFAALVARQVGTFNGYDPTLGDSQGSRAIGQTLTLLGLIPATDLRLQRDDLEGLRKPALFAIAKDAGVTGKMSDLKTSELADYIHNQAPPAYILPTLRFATKGDVEAVFAIGAAA